PWLTIRYHRVDVTIEDQVATTRVDQVFRNDSAMDAEGTYIFPIPPGAVVDEFVMWVDGEPIEGKILDADEARAIYESYVRRRRDPALLEYVGRDAVQARIFPIPPGEERRIELEYSEILPVDEALMHYRYPLDTERFSAQPLEQVSIHVEMRSQTPIRALYSATHQDEILIQREGRYNATVSYEANDIYPNRDFELYVGFGDVPIGANLLTYQQPGEDGFFLLMLSPALDVESDEIIPKDLFLVLDKSGSMEGEKLEQAKAALDYVLRHLNPEDRFNVIAFSSDVRTYASDLRPASEGAEAADWITGLEALGGTNIYLALSEALLQADEERPTVVIFLTDGLPTEGIVDEQSLLDTLEQEAPESVRIFPFGVGYDVNTLLLDQLADDHRGRPAYVQPDESINEAVSAFYGRVQSPLLTDIELDFGDVAAYDLYPRPLPDLYAGTQLIVTGRYTGSGPEIITLSGKVQGRGESFTYEGNFVFDGGRDFIPRLWAARKIGYLLTQIRLHGENQELIEAVVELSLRYGIITPYTSFLIEEEDILTEEGQDKVEEEFWAAPTAPATGESAVEEAEERLGLGGADAPLPAYEAPEEIDGGKETTRIIRYAGDKTFLCEAGVCTDTTFSPERMEPKTIRFDSETYWALLSAHPEWAQYFALAPEVIFVAIDGTAYAVRTGDNVVEDEITISPEEITETDATPTPEPGSPTEPAPLTEPTPDGGGQDLCAPAFGIAFLALLLLWFSSHR
ncbi:MAG: VIT domain-containing protein, partial [Anaerolineae bacterium]